MMDAREGTGTVLHRSSVCIYPQSAAVVLRFFLFAFFTMYLTITVHSTLPCKKWLIDDKTENRHHWIKIE